MKKLLAICLCVFALTATVVGCTDAGSGAAGTSTKK